MKRPPGLKIYKNLLLAKDIAIILEKQEYIENLESKLFRLYGDFGSKEAPEATAWMKEYGQKILDVTDIFKKLPNQYRVCDWIGELSANFKWHIDNKRHGEKLLAICLEKRCIGFRPRATSKDMYKLELEKGDAYLMAGKCRWSWEHCVLPMGKEKSGGKSFIVSYRKPKK